MATLSDLVRDNQLETSFEDKFTIHHYDDSDGEEQRRSSYRSEYWEESGWLARGGFGEVLLQRCVKGRRTPELRAVKKIARSMARHGGKQFDFVSELEAIAKFSHRRVSFPEILAIIGTLQKLTLQYQVLEMFRQTTRMVRN